MEFMIEVEVVKPDQLYSKTTFNKQLARCEFTVSINFKIKHHTDYIALHVHIKVKCQREQIINMHRKRRAQDENNRTS